jgi:hypothetical protein
MEAINSHHMDEDKKAINVEMLSGIKLRKIKAKLIMKFIT